MSRPAPTRSSLSHLVSYGIQVSMVKNMDEKISKLYSGSDLRKIVDETEKQLTESRSKKEFSKDYWVMYLTRAQAYVHAYRVKYGLELLDLNDRDMPDDAESRLKLLQRKMTVNGYVDCMYAMEQELDKLRKSLE